MASPSFQFDSLEKVVTVDVTKNNWKTPFLRSIVMIQICALLNTFGTTRSILFNCRDLETKDIDVFKNKIESKVKEGFGSGILLDCVRINDVFDENQSKPTTFTCVVNPCSSFCSLDYNLFLPSSTQVTKLKSESIEKILSIINYRWESPFELIIENKICLKKGEMFQKNESDVTQFKYFKEDKEEKPTSKWLGRKIEKNNFTHYISAFANHHGGHIYYGVEDTKNMILGQKLNASGKVDVANKINSILERMVWGKNLETKPKIETDWDIQYIPVCDKDGTEIEDLFVIAVSVRPFPNGVFSQEPESYEWKDGEAVRIEYQDWRERVQMPNKCFHQYSTITDRNARMNCFEIINKVERTLERRTYNFNFREFVWLKSKLEVCEDESQSGNPKPECITCYLEFAYLYSRGGNFEAADWYMDKANEHLTSVRNRPVLEMHYSCLQASLARKRGELKRSLCLTYDCLAETEAVLPGWENAMVWKTHGHTLAEMAALENDAYRRRKIKTQAEHAWCKAIEHAQRVFVTRGDEKNKQHALIKIIRHCYLYSILLHLGLSPSGKDLEHKEDTNVMTEKFEAVLVTRQSGYHFSMRTWFLLYTVLSLFDEENAWKYGNECVTDIELNEIENTLSIQELFAERAQRIAIACQFTDLNSLADKALDKVIEMPVSQW